MIEEFGGHYGYIMYAEEAYKKIIQDVKEKQDLFSQAGELFLRLRRTRLVEDGLRRTAYTITATFLEENGEKMYEIDQEKIILFMNGALLESTSDQVASWLRNGKI